MAVLLGSSILKEQTKKEEELLLCKDSKLHDAADCSSCNVANSAATLRYIHIQGALSFY